MVRNWNSSLGRRSRWARQQNVAYNCQPQPLGCGALHWLTNRAGSRFQPYRASTNHTFPKRCGRALATGRLLSLQPFRISRIGSFRNLPMSPGERPLHPLCVFLCFLCLGGGGGSLPLQPPLLRGTRPPWPSQSGASASPPSPPRKSSRPSDQRPPPAAQGEVGSGFKEATTSSGMDDMD